MIPDSIQDLFRTYRKEITLIVATAVVTFLFTRALPAIGKLLSSGFAYLVALCTGQGREYRFLRKYLQWVVNDNRYSPVIPSQMLDPGKLPKVPQLEEVYIRLQLRASNDEQLELGVASLLNAGARAVILGDPGAGKTTFLKYLALIHANRSRASFLNLRSRRRAREAVGSHARLIPVLIHLNRLYRDPVQSPDLLTVALNGLPERLRAQCPLRFFEKLLESGDALILLDGLDEIASAEQRLRAMKEIAELSNTTPPRTRWIVTSRIVGYKPKLQEHNFQLAVVQHLTPQQVEQFVMNWYASKCESAGYKPDEIEYQRNVHATRAQHLVDTLESNVGLRSLATSPMLVSLITMLHSVRLELPENRSLLYRDCVELLAGRWDIDRGVAGNDYGLPVSISQKIAFLIALAWRMHNEKRREIGESEVAGLLSEHLSKVVPAVTSEMTKAFIDVLLERSGIIISRGISSSGDRLLAFSHLSFQEYLASRWLHGLPHEEADAFVLERHSESWWREAILLRMAQMEFPLDLTTQIYRRAWSEGKIDGVVFAGYSLAEVQAERNSDIFRSVAGDLAFIASAGSVRNLATDILTFDRNNLFLRYLITTVEDIVRLRPKAAQVIFHLRRGEIDGANPQRAVAELTGRGDLASFERQFVLAADRFGVPLGLALQAASRFPGAVQELMEGWEERPLNADAFEQGQWSDLIRLASGGWIGQYKEGSAALSSSWKHRLIVRSRAPRTTHVPSAPFDSDLARSLMAGDEVMAGVGIHMALCGVPFSLDESGLAALDEEGIANRSPVLRSLIVSALLLSRFPLSSPAMRVLKSFVSRTRTIESAQDAWRAALARRCLERIRPEPSASMEFLVFAFDCLRRSVDHKEFAAGALWKLGALEGAAAEYCLRTAESENLDMRWGAILALANAREHVNDQMLKVLLAQLYEREHRVLGQSLRDVAGSSLMRLAAAA
jgi:energy-coupling factor transporter ATP-binding protein EcfA2